MAIDLMVATIRYRWRKLAIVLPCFIGLLATGADGRAGTAGLEVYDALLHEHVHDGHVDYRGFAASEKFGDYLDEIADRDPESFGSAEERLAFYINAYNALTIQSIVTGKSPANLLGRFGFFKRNKHVVAGESISLFDFEHERLIAQKEPRLHFAIVCASASCPPLRSEAYRPEILDQQLDDQAIKFINDSSKNAFDEEKKIAWLSKIFKWYREEFETIDSSIGDYVAFYLKDPGRASALKEGEYKIKFQKYDWSLNGTAP